jgi:hypothetical protein
MTVKSRQMMLSIGITIILIVLVGLGFATGRYTTINKFEALIDGYDKASFLGRILKDKNKLEVTRAYHNSDSILDQLNDISWAVPNMPTPFVGNAPTPGQHGVAYINSMQFRAKKEIEIPKPINTFRIFLTGGSTAYGSGAPSQDRTIAGYLSTMLSRNLTPSTKLNYEVFTMANPAWATTHERIIIENRLSELDPDLIISFSGNNDVHWGELGRNVFWFRSYADEYFLNLIKAAYSLLGKQQIPEIIQIKPSEISPYLVAERLIKNVKLSSFVLSQKQVDYVFVLQPTLAVTGKSLTKREQKCLKNQEYFQKCYTQIDNRLRDMNANNFRYVNLTGVFDNMNNQEDIFIDSYHFGDKGNEIIAENIYLQIKDIIIQ